MIVRVRTNMMHRLGMLLVMTWACVLMLGVSSASAALKEYAVDAELPRSAVWTYQAPSLDPRSVQAMPDGSALVASRDGEAILVVRSNSRETIFSKADYEQLFGALPSAGFFCAEMHGDRMLVVSRWGRRVFELQRAGTSWSVNWVYGDGTKGFGPNQLFDPFFATYSNEGDVLIADDQGDRVLQVRISDYDAALPDSGFTDASVVWQFGEPDVAGFTGQLLTQPRSIEQMADGTMVILDTGHRAIRVRKTGPRTGEIIWTYGVPGVAGDAVGELNDPNRARVLDNGNILISDGNNARILEVDPNQPDPVKATVWTCSGTDPGSAIIEPRDSVRAADGLTYIADSTGNQVVVVGYDTSSRVVSGSLDCGLPGVRKRLNALSWAGSAPEGTAVRLELSTDGGSTWIYAGPGNPWRPTTPIYVTLVRYRLTLTATDRARTPVVSSVSFECVAAPLSADSDSDGTGSPGATTGTADKGSGPPPGSGSSSSTRSGSAGTGTGTAGTGGAGGVVLVPKNSGSAAVTGSEPQAADAIGVSSDMLRGMALSSAGNEGVPGAIGAFSSGESGEGGPQGGLLLLVGLYGGGLVKGVLTIRSLAMRGLAGGLT